MLDIADAQPSTVVIAGGAGFIGASIAASLLKQRFNVIAVDNGLFEPASILREIRETPNFRVADIDASDDALLRKVLPDRRKIKAIVNCVGPARPSYYRVHPIKTAQTILRSSISLAQLAADYKVPLIVASSSEIYGDLGPEKMSEGALGRTQTLSVRAAYAESKRAAETVAWSFAHETGLKLSILRLFNVYGPGYSDDDDRVIPNFISSLKNRLPLPIHGSGKQMRSFSHIDDVVDAFIRAITIDISVPLCVNVGTPEPISILDLGKLIADKMKVPFSYNFTNGNSDEIPFRCPDINEAFEKLSWEPRINLDTGLTRLVRSQLPAAA